MWKLYVKEVGLEKEDEDDNIDLSKVTAEEVFFSFGDSQSQIKPAVKLIKAA